MKTLLTLFDFITSLINKFLPNQVFLKEALCLFEAMVNESTS